MSLGFRVQIGNCGLAVPLDVGLGGGRSTRNVSLNESQQNVWKGTVGRKMWDPRGSDGREIRSGFGEYVDRAGRRDEESPGEVAPKLLS